jgi:hypothetical protein
MAGDDERGRVRIEQIQGFGQFASGLTGPRQSLTSIGAHEHTVPMPPGALPDADLSGAYTDLTTAIEAAITRVAAFGTGGDRHLAGLAFVSNYVGTNFPETDMANEQQMASLMFDGQQAAPPVPANQLPIDPAFRSRPAPRS